MIYLVTKQLKLFESSVYKTLTVKESLTMLNNAEYLEYDSETNGVDARINTLLCVQFGSDKEDFQIVVDTSTIDIKLYKEY